LFEFLSLGMKDYEYYRSKCSPVVVEDNQHSDITYESTVWNWKV
jgi:hypothetical protein